MLQQQEYIQNTEEEFSQIDSVKAMIEDLRDSGNFFSLSLKTLELIRRFNNLYVEVFQKHDNNPSFLNQLVILANGLEGELVREN